MCTIARGVRCFLIIIVITPRFVLKKLQEPPLFLWHDDYSREYGVWIAKKQTALLLLKSWHLMESIEG